MLRGADKRLCLERDAQPFEVVADSSNKVMQLMGEVSAASLEQSQGIDQINRAVTEMNQTTQENAASAEELLSLLTGNASR